MTGHLTALDLDSAALQGANEVALVVRQAPGRAVVDADQEGIGVELHQASWLLQACGTDGQ
jgi:hypothetical protein